MEQNTECTAVFEHIRDQVVCLLTGDTQNAAHDPHRRLVEAWMAQNGIWQKLQALQKSK